MSARRDTAAEAPKALTGLDAYDLGGIQQLLQEGVLTSEDLVKTYQARIAEVNFEVAAVGLLNPDALELARERDAQRSNGHLLGDLHGIPILVKDTFVTDDKMDTTGGSYVLVGARFRTPSTAVKRLENAGAIILGKTNLSQWGYARSVDCPNGWSALHGQAMAGFLEDLDPHGSSSGSAIAAAMNLAGAALGGETCGSIIYPAQRSAVVGLKPTVGLTSRAGSIPVNPVHDTVGPITRFVKDSARMLQVLAGRDELDPATSEIPFEIIPDYVAACSATRFEGMRIAIPRSVYSGLASDPELETAFEGAVDTLRRLGATIVDDCDFEMWKPGGGQREDYFADILLRESLEKFFADMEVNPYGLRTLADLVELLKALPEEDYANVGANWFERARDAKGSSESEAFLACKSWMEQLGLDPVRLLDSTKCDVLLATSSTDLPLDLGRLPGISVPLGFYSERKEARRGRQGLIMGGPNVPFALLFAGRRFSEEKLLSCAYAFEQATLVVQDAPRRMWVKPVTDIAVPSTSQL